MTMPGPMDDLARLYREHAREAPSSVVDERILAMAAGAVRPGFSRQRLGWLAALAALLLVWLVTYPHRPMPPRARSVASSTRDAGYDEGRTRTFLLGMDISPPPSLRARQLQGLASSP